MKIVLFGTGNAAEVAYAYLCADSPYEVVAFTVETAFMSADSKFGHPVVPFETVEEQYPPSQFRMFAPCTGTKLSTYRERIYKTGKDKGYAFISYVSPKASVMTSAIGENCLILEHNTIQPYVSIGDNCVIWSGNHIGHHTYIAPHVFISSHVVISGNCNVEQYAWLGVNSSMRDGIVVKEGCILAMGASATKNTEPYGIYAGTPAKRLRDCDKNIEL